MGLATRQRRGWGRTRRPVASAGGEAKPALAWVPRTEGFGPALSGGAELQGVLGGAARPSRTGLGGGGRPWCPAQPRVSHLRGRLGAARRRGRPAGTAAAGGGGVSWCGRSASSARPLGLSVALAVMALLFIRAAQEGRGTHARHPSPRPATVDVASRRPEAGPAVREITWPAALRVGRAPSGLPREPGWASLPIPYA